jgi:hypothetical protein
MPYVRASSPLRQVINVLSDINDIEMRFKAGDGFVGVVWLTGLDIIPSVLIELQHSFWVFLPTFLVGYVFYLVIVP